MNFRTVQLLRFYCFYCSPINVWKWLWYFSSILLTLKGKKRVRFIDAFIPIKRRQMRNIKFM